MWTSMSEKLPRAVVSEDPHIVVGFSFRKLSMLCDDQKKRFLLGSGKEGER